MKVQNKDKMLGVSPITPERIDLNWPVIKGAHDYVVKRRKHKEASSNEQIVAIVQDADYIDRDLLPGTKYRYVIIARASDGKQLCWLSESVSTLPDGLSVSHEASILTVRGDTFEITWDEAKGGEITTIRQYDGDSWFRINDSKFHTMPGFILSKEKHKLSTSNKKRKVAFLLEKQTKDELLFSFFEKAENIEIGLRYHVFKEGMLFCEMTIPRDAAGGTQTQGVDAEKNMKKIEGLCGRLGLHLSQDILAGKFTWRYFRRGYPPASAWMKRDERATDKNRMMPIATVQYGRSQTAGFTNCIEMFIEDSPSYGASTWFGDDGKDGFKLEWTFSGRALRDLYYVCWDMGFLRTRWGLFLGAARKGHAGRVPASQRNNIIGAGIFHVTGSQAVLDSRAEKWPYNVPPANLITDKKTMLPSDEQIRSAQRQGADLIILHQFWMRSGGSNGEPPADYIPREPDDLKRFVDSCHSLGIRVGLYMRGIEKHAMFQPYFENLMRRNFDGLYVDHNTPYSIGFQGCNERHYSAYNYFLFTRALRERVGDKGFLIGHAGPLATAQATAVFDAYLPGEFKEQRYNFFNSPDEALQYGFAACIGVNPIYLPEFTTDRAVAFYAGLGMHAHVRPINDAHHLEGLWRIWRSIPMDQAVMHNGKTENLQFIHPSLPDVLSTAYRVNSDLLLVVAANLGKAGNMLLRVDLPALGMSGKYKVTELSGRRPSEFQSKQLDITSEGVIKAGRFSRYDYKGYRIEREK